MVSAVESTFALVVRRRMFGVLVMVAELSDEWPGSSYHPFRRNCNHFADALCRKLTGAGMPTYVNRFATSIAAKAAFYCCLVPFECFLDWRCRGPSEASKDCCTDEQVKMTVAKVLSLEKEVARLRHELHSAEDFWQNEQAIIKTARLPRLETELRELRCELHVVKQYPSPRLQQAPQQLQLGPALHRCEQKGDQQHPAAASGTQLQQLRVLKRKVARLSKDAHLLKQFLAVSKVSPTASAHDLQPHSLLYRSQSRRLRVRYAQQRLCGKLGRRTKCCRHGKPRHRQWADKWTGDSFTASALKGASFQTISILVFTSTGIGTKKLNCRARLGSVSGIRTLIGVLGNF